MKKKEWLNYFIDIVLILAIVFGGQHIYEKIRENSMGADSGSIFFISIVMLIIFTAIGAVLGWDHFREERKKEGQWRMNLPKVILLGIPSLYFSLSVFLYFGSSFAGNAVLIAPIKSLLFAKGNLIDGFQLVLGHTIITSFYKQGVIKK